MGSTHWRGGVNCAPATPTGTLRGTIVYHAVSVAQQGSIGVGVVGITQDLVSLVALGGILRQEVRPAAQAARKG